MPQAPAFDSGQLDLAIGYDVLSPDLDPTPRLVDGANMLVTAKGKLVKRPGSLQVTGTSLSYRIDRLALVESLDTPSLVYLVASAYNGATWTAYYNRLDGSTGWVTLGTLRDVNASTRPHEFVVSRGQCYIKGYPASGSSEKLGTVVFVPNGGTPYVTFWGLLGPTAPAALSSSAGWSASANAVTVNVGWAYTYAYKSRTGHVSNRAPMETNPSKAPSVTPAFTNKIPSMTLAGHSDTTNVPTIVVYRTTDGGGTFFKLKEITNTGGSITFTDHYLESGAGGGTFNDPQPDKYLDTSAVSPDLVSNTPPITVLAEQGTVGVTTPSPSTPIESYAARLWYAIGNVLFFSAQEELSEGVPEEAWPAGLRGNFFRFQHPVVTLKATTEALYVFTTEKTYWVRGSSRDSLQALPLFDDLGAKRGHAHARCAADTSVLFLTHDGRVCIARGKQRDFLSDPLNATLKDAMAAGAELRFARHAELDKDWLVILGVRTDDTTACRQWVYDFNQGKQGLWNVPWTQRVTACVAGQAYDTTDTARKLLWATWQGSASGLVATDMSLVTVQDYLWGTGATNYACSARVSLVGNPAGNHLNTLRVPAQASVLYGIKADRTKFTSDTDPTLDYWLDDISATPTVTGAPNLVDPPRRITSVGYKTLQWQINHVCERVGVRISKAAINERFELQTLAALWTPDAGA